MAKNKITLRFNLLTYLSISIFAGLSLLFLLLGRVASENATVSSSIIYTFSILFELFLLFTFVCIFSGIIYAHSFFSFKKALVVTVFSSATIVIYKLSELLHFTVFYDAEAAYIKAFAITLLIEFLIYLPAIILPLVLSTLFARLRCRENTKKKHSPFKCSIICVCTYAVAYYVIIPVIEIITEFIIPQLGVITSDDTSTIILDILYVCRNFPAIIILGIAFTFLFSFVQVKFTGKLKLKQYYVAVKTTK